MKHRLANLDLLRGLSALAVCAGHLRAFLFVDFRQISTPGMWDRLFYFATGLGHQAVIVFFVLSGYLVGGSVLAAYESGRWSWSSYALRRMSRLWVVLIPALALTWTLDSAGLYLGGTGYDGSLNSLYSSGPTSAFPTDLRATTFLGNLVFLQTVCVPFFGTNGPLWSLANEFWYYVIFPLLCGVMFARSVSRRFACATVSLVLIWWLPREIVLRGLIWLMGVGGFWAGRPDVVRRILGHPVSVVVTGVVAVGTLVASKVGSFFGSEWCMGIAFSLWIVGLANCEHRVSWIKIASAALSEMSYTLYVVHFPVLAFVFFCAFGGRQFQPDRMTYVWFAEVLTAVTVFSSGVWWCFERNTDRLRRGIEWAFVFRRDVAVTVERG